MKKERGKSIAQVALDDLERKTRKKWGICVNLYKDENLKIIGGMWG